MRRGRPPGEWSDEEWVKRHYETQERRILGEIVRYLKERMSKGKGVSIFDLSRQLGHGPDVIKRVVEKYNGMQIDGVLGGFETRKGYYIVWCKVGEDPVLCLHWNEIAMIPVEPNNDKVICPGCGATYLVQGRLCKCGARLRGEGRNLYCDECGAVYLDCGGVFKRVPPTLEELGDFFFSSLGSRSPRRLLIDFLDRFLGEDRPPLPCEIIKEIRNAICELLPPSPVRVNN